jgi:hypothetical protein
MNELQDQKVVSAPVDTTVLNEDTYKTLSLMLKSNDEGDHRMAQSILNQLDIRASIYYIWKLARQNSNKMVNLRTKLSRKFRDETSLFHLDNCDEQEFGVWLERKGWLTPELFMKLRSGIRDRLQRCNNDPFYDLHATIKDEYKHLHPEDRLTNFKDIKHE